MTEAVAESRVARPPYIPWKTFVSFVSRWKSDTVPHTINTTILTNMSGAMAAQLVSTLRFLGLIDAKGVVDEQAFGALVTAHGTDQWAGAVKEHVVSAYEGIVGDLPLENAIASQLDDKFRKNGGAEGQVLDKCVRFYLHSLRDAGVKYSPHFSIRRERKSNGTRKKSVSKRSSESRKGPTKTETPVRPTETPLSPDLIEIPLTIPGKSLGQKLIVSAELDEADCDYIDAILRAQAKRIALAKGE